jgi:toxin ParE1/3/4
MKYVFHPEALAEYSDAVRYYSEQKTEIAQGFINAIKNAIFRIKESPERYAAIDEDIRRCMTGKFY